MKHRIVALLAATALLTACKEQADSKVDIPAAEGAGPALNVSLSRDSQTTDTVTTTETAATTTASL